MKSFLLGMAGALLILTAYMAGRVTEQRTIHVSAPPYEIRTSGVTDRTFVFDPKTGALWRYYFTLDAAGKLATEGVEQLAYSNPPVSR